MNSNTSPSFPVVGLHVDLRVQVMPMPALRRLARDIASLGYNTMVMEWEASFPFRRHAVISNGFAYTEEEVAGFVKYCRELGLSVIPVQQCFGHVEYILRHERYAALREDRKDLCQICPRRERPALEVFGEIFEEIARLHPSPYLHIGGDETYLLGRCERCRKKAEKEGLSALYVDYFRRIASRVSRMGKVPMLWADMLLRHPDAADKMPKETVFVDWNYGWPIDRFGDPRRLPRDRFSFWGAAALRSSPDNHWITCWKRHFDNFRDYVPYARKTGFEGILLTSWSTSGAYGYEWNSERDVTELLPIRRVYPLVGHRVLLAAFARAVWQHAPLNGEEFIMEYGEERFGLARSGGRRLAEALFLGELEARSDHWGAAALLATRACRILTGLQPKRHAAEFRHFLLMAELRRHHLQFRHVEEACHRTDFTNKRIPGVVAKLNPLMKEIPALAKRFATLNAGEIYPAEMELENNYRFGKLRALHARMAREGRRTGSPA